MRLTLETDDGALILTSYRGVRHASPEVSARRARGEGLAGWLAIAIAPAERR